MHFLPGRNLPETTDGEGGRMETFIQFMQEASKVISPQDPARAASIVTVWTVLSEASLP